MTGFQRAVTGGTPLRLKNLSNTNGKINQPTFTILPSSKLPINNCPKSTTSKVPTFYAVLETQSPPTTFRPLATFPKNHPPLDTFIARESSRWISTLMVPEEVTTKSWLEALLPTLESSISLWIRLALKPNTFRQVKFWISVTLPSSIKPKTIPLLFWLAPNTVQDHLGIGPPKDPTFWVSRPSSPNLSKESIEATWLEWEFCHSNSRKAKMPTLWVIFCFILGLKGTERFDIDLRNGNLKVSEWIKVRTDSGKEFEAKVRLDTDVEIEYFKNGGILQYVLRKLNRGE